MLSITIEDNIELSLTVTQDYFKKIIEEPSNVKNYKMVIISLHNALELTFKYIISRENEYMIYTMQDANSYQKVINAFKEKRLHRNEDKINNLHTINFSTAYEILAYLYNDEHFDAKFIFNLQKIEKLRNALTHFNADITETDIITLYGLYEKCVLLYHSKRQRKISIKDVISNKSISTDTFSFDPWLKTQLDQAIMKYKETLLSNPLVQNLIGYLIKTIQHINDDIRLDDYSELCEFFKQNCYEKLKESYRRDKAKSSTSLSFEDYISRGVYLLLESGFLVNRDYCDSIGIPILGGISLSESCKELILKKYNKDEKSIKQIFGLSEKEFDAFCNFRMEDDGYEDYCYEDTES